MISLYNKLTKSSIFRLFRTNQIIQVVLVLQGVLLARLLGPTGRGTYAEYYAIMNVMASTVLLGQNIFFLHRENIGNRVSSVVMGIAIRSLLIGIVIGVAIIYFGYLTGTIFALALAFIVVNNVMVLLHTYDIKTKEIRRYNLTRNSLNPFIIVGVLLVYLLNGLTVETLLVVIILSNLVQIILWFYLSEEGIQVNYRQVVEEFLDASSFTSGLKFAGYGLSDTLLAWGDKVLLVYLFSSDQVGFYVVALSAAGLSSPLATAFSTNLLSTISSKRGLIEWPRILNYLAQFLLITLSVQILLFLILPVLIDLFYGEEFYNSISLSRELLPLVLVVQFQVILEAVAKGIGMKYKFITIRVMGFSFFAMIGVIHSSLSLAEFIYLNIVFSAVVGLSQLWLIRKSLINR